MYLWSIRKMLPPFLGNLYASMFNYGRTPHQGLESFAQLVHQHQPTLICLQEVYGAAHQGLAQYEELEKMIGSGYHWFTGGSKHEKRAILIQRNILNGHPSENISTSDGAHFGVAYKLDRPTAWVVSVHLGYSNLEERARQLEQLQQWAYSKNEPILLAGDFNTHISWASSEMQHAAYHTFHVLTAAGFVDLSDSVACTWRWGKYLPTAGKIKLDHFFGRGVKAVEKPIAIRDHLRGWMDHLALFGPKFVVE